MGYCGTANGVRANERAEFAVPVFAVVVVIEFRQPLAHAFYFAVGPMVGQADAFGTDGVTRFNHVAFLL